MKIKIHPKHIDINSIQNTSTYTDTMTRFDSILQNKIGINEGKVKKLKSDISVNKVDKFNLKAEQISKNVKQKSINPSSKINTYFKNTSLKNLGKSFEKAQEKYGINAYFLASIASLESANGTSSIAKDKSNLFGFGAYDDSPYRSAKKFSSFEEGIDKVAKYLSEEYLHENGSYYLGTSIKDINKSYATDKEWHKKLKNILDKMIE